MRGVLQMCVVLNLGIKVNVLASPRVALRVYAIECFGTSDRFSRRRAKTAVGGAEDLCVRTRRTMRRYGNEKQLR